MRICNFSRPETGYPVDDFQTRITELFLHLQSDLGGVDKVNDVLFRMFELSFPQATPEEKLDFTRIQGAVRCMNCLIDQHTEAITDLLEEQKFYDSKNIQ